MMAENISHPVVHGRSVTVQRHRHSGNLKVSPTNLRTHGEGSRDACAPNKVLWQRCNCGCFTGGPQIKQWHKIRKERSILMERGIRVREKECCLPQPANQGNEGRPTNQQRKTKCGFYIKRQSNENQGSSRWSLLYLDFCVDFMISVMITERYYP